MHRIVIHCRSTARCAAKRLWVADIGRPLLHLQRHDGAAHKIGALRAVVPVRSIAPQRPKSLRQTLLIQ